MSEFTPTTDDADWGLFDVPEHKACPTTKALNGEGA